MLADFCFADLLLYAPARDGRWLVIGQVRPVTGQTLYLSDWVGSSANETELAAAARRRTRPARSARARSRSRACPTPTRMLAIPVRRRAGSSPC